MAQFHFQKSVESLDDNTLIKLVAEVYRTSVAGDVRLRDPVLHASVLRTRSLNGNQEFNDLARGIPDFASELLSRQNCLRTWSFQSFLCLYSPHSVFSSIR